jgi:hypothetical protein
MDIVAVRGRNSGRNFCLVRYESAVWQKLPSISQEPAASITVLYPDGGSTSQKTVCFKISAERISNGLTFHDQSWIYL